MLSELVEKALLKEHKPVSFDKLCSRIIKIGLLNDSNFSLSYEDRGKIKDILDKGVDDYNYYRTPNGNYILMSKTTFRDGVFYGDRNGNGKVSSTLSYKNHDGKMIVKKEEYLVSRDNTNGAIDGDRVLIDTSLNNKVVKVIDRQLSSIVGEVYRVGGTYFVRPIDKKKKDLMISIGDEGIEGERVAVDLVGHSSDNFYTGVVRRVFNHKDDPEEDVLWEAFKYGIDDQFSPESLEQVKNIPQSVRDIDKIGREDLTGLTVFTIDGADTKDIDDAVSCKVLPNGNYEIGVHIADVSYYVREGSPLDRDAFRKGTSNYLVGKVIPMLPHELSNGICSLNPYVERLALSCLMEVTPKGEVIRRRITPSVIKSRIKMTYDKVNDILKYNKIDPEYSNYSNDLYNLNKLALVLRRNRLKKGAIEFDRPELKVVLDDDGKISGFSRRESDLGENLIEEFMLLANETVDKFVVSNGYPCLHRVHGGPNASRIDQLLTFLSLINYPFKAGVYGDDVAESRKLMQELVKHTSDAEDISMLLTTELIKCNSRAKYSPNNIGHYGLAKDYYCHFTSPIRRYPDLVVHRIVKDILNNKNNMNEWAKKLPEIGERSSRMERNADEAETATLKMKTAKYMEDHIGEEYTGVITTMSDRGLTIELDSLIECYARIKDLRGKYYYSSEDYSMISLDGFDNYFVGDRIKVKILSADGDEKKINVEIVEKIRENKISSKYNEKGKVLCKK